MTCEVSEKYTKIECPLQRHKLHSWVSGGEIQLPNLILQCCCTCFRSLKTIMQNYYIIIEDMPSLVSHQLSIIKYVVLKKIFFFLCFDRLIWTWTWTWTWTRTSLDSDLTRTRTSLDLDLTRTRTSLDLDLTRTRTSLDLDLSWTRQRWTWLQPYPFIQYFLQPPSAS